MQNKYKFLIIIFSMLALSACSSSLFNRQRYDYLKSQATPPLVVPENLSASKIHDAYHIPTIANRGNLPASITPPGDLVATKKIKVNYQIRDDASSYPVLVADQSSNTTYKELRAAITRTGFRIVSSNNSNKTLVVTQKNLRYELRVLPIGSDAHIFAFNAQGKKLSYDDARNYLEKVDIALQNKKELGLTRWINKEF